MLDVELPNAVPAGLFCPNRPEDCVGCAPNAGVDDAPLGWPNSPPVLGACGCCPNSPPLGAWPNAGVGCEGFVAPNAPGCAPVLAPNAGVVLGIVAPGAPVPLERPWR